MTDRNAIADTEDMMVLVTSYSALGAFFAGFALAGIGLGCFVWGLVATASLINDVARAIWTSTALSILGSVCLFGLSLLFVTGIKLMAAAFFDCYLKAGPLGISAQRPDLNPFSFHIVRHRLVGWQDIAEMREHRTIIHTRGPFGWSTRTQREFPIKLRDGSRIDSILHSPGGDAIHSRLRAIAGMTTRLYAVRMWLLENGYADEKIKAVLKDLLAAEVLQGGIGLPERRAQEHYEQGNRSYLGKDFDRAIAEYTAAIALDPELMRAYLYRGDAESTLKKFDTAIADYNEVLRLDRNSALAYYGRGVAYHGKGDRDRAIAGYNEAIRLDPTAASAYWNRAILRKAKGDTAGADADYAKAKELNPKFRT